MKPELSDENRAKVEDGAKRIYNEYLTLQDLRNAKQMTQQELSRRLNKRQSPSPKWKSTATS